jgi:hypothetical protein
VWLFLLFYDERKSRQKVVSRNPMNGKGMELLHLLAGCEGAASALLLPGGRTMVWKRLRST